jgi:hypothetical protein
MTSPENAANAPNARRIIRNSIKAAPWNSAAFSTRSPYGAGPVNIWT